MTLMTVIGVMVFTSSVVPARADDLQQQLNQSNQQVSQINGALQSQKNKVSSATTQVLVLTQSVKALESSITREKVVLADQQKNLNGLEAQQQKLELKRQEHIEALGSYLKNNYEDGVSTYLAVLFGATSISDFIDRADKLQMIVGTYGQLQKDIADLNQNINNQKNAIQKNETSIKASLLEKTQTQTSIQQALDKQKAVLSQLSSTEQTLVKSSVAAKDKVSRIQQLIQQQELEASYAASSAYGGSSYSGVSRGGVTGLVSISGGAQQILSFASQFLGLPYVWGGTTPSPGFDCSGFTQYVFSHAGISLGRTSEQQFYDGVYVSRSELQPGDLVFFHTYTNDASHVGIYVGNNTMLDSSNGGVSYDDMTNSYWASRYLGARRVIAH